MAEAARRSVGERKTLALLGGAALLVAVSAVLAVLALRSDSGEGITALDAAAGERAPESAGAVAPASVVDVRRALAEEGAASGAQGVATASPPAGGVLVVRVVDERDAPVADLAVTVYCERGRRRRLAQLVTDAAGTARVEGLTEDLYLVETRRAPPYAPTLAAEWLPAGEQRELDVRLRRGGRLEGRVVDDRGAPVEGAELVLRASDLGLRPFGPGEGDLEEIVATSAADGTFAIDAVASRPWGVWLVDGELRPERWDLVSVTARLGPAATSASAPVDQGETVTLPDLVLPRPSRLAGVVLDADERPVAAARVAASWRGPSRGARAEATTAADGAFELASDALTDRLRVTTPDGHAQEFPLAPGAPGAVVEDLVLRLDPFVALELELVDAAGAPVDPTAVNRSRPRPTILGRVGRHLLYGRVRAIAYLADGDVREVVVTPDEAGRVRASWSVAPSALRVLQVFVDGWRAGVLELGVPPRSGERVRLVLEPLPRLALRLVPDPAWTPPAKGVSLYVQAWSEGAQRVESTTYVELGAEPIPFDLLVTGTDLHEVRVEPARLAAGRRSEDLRRSFGPFAPAPERRELALDAAWLAAVAAAQAEPASVPEEKTTPPEPSRPGEERERGTLVVRAVDAVAGDPLPAASLSVRRATETYSEGGRSGRLRTELEPGAWTIVVEADGYRTSAPLAATVVAGETTDLGTVALEPWPELSGRLVHADDTPVSLPFQVRLVGTHTDGRRFGRWLETDHQGRFRLRAELPDRFELVVQREAGGEHGRGALQVRELARWPAASSELVRLAPWRLVKVELPEGATDAYGFVQPASEPRAEEHGFGGGGGVSMGLLDETLPGAHRRTSSVLLGPGRYRLGRWSGGPADDAPEVDVEPGDEPLVLRLAPR